MGGIKLLDARELAREIGLNFFTVQRLARCGVIPVVRLGYRTVRFNVIEVEAALLEHEIHPRPLTAAMRRRRPRVRAVMLQNSLHRQH
jgi:hypothetical protein